MKFGNHLDISRWWSNDKNLELKGLLPLDLRFESCGCSYDGHWRFTWLLISGFVGLVEMRTNWHGQPIKLKKKKKNLVHSAHQHESKGSPHIYISTVVGKALSNYFFWELLVCISEIRGVYNFF